MSPAQPDGDLRGPASVAARVLGPVVERPGWIPRVVLLAWALAVALSFPGYERTGAEGVRYLRDKYAAVLELTIEHPLADMARFFPEWSNPAKRTFRVTVPLVARVTHTGIVGALLLNYVCAYATLHLTALLAFRILGNRVDAALLVIALAGTYFGTAAFKDIFGWFDSVAFALLLSATVQRRGVWRVMALLAAFFTDERALLVAPATVLGSVTSPGVHRPAWRQVASLGSAVALYAAIRVCLTIALDLAATSDAIGLQTAKAHVPVLGPALWSGLEGLWILVIAGVLILLRHVDSSRGLVALGAAYFAAYAVSCFLVIDVTRSLAFAVVGVFPLLVALRDRVDRTRLRSLLAVSAAVSILAPNLFVWDYLDYELPLPVRLGMSLFGDPG